MMIVGGFYGHGREGVGVVLRQPCGVAWPCSAPHPGRQISCPFAISWEKGLFFGFFFFTRAAAGRWARVLGRPSPAAPPPWPGAEVGSVCMWHCGISDRRGEARKEGGEGRKKKKKLKILQEKTILPRTAVNKITAVG